MRSVANRRKAHTVDRGIFGRVTKFIISFATNGVPAGSSSMEVPPALYCQAEAGRFQVYRSSERGASGLLSIYQVSRPDR